MGKLIGGILLIVGTSIGSGMLALPLATAAGGFFHSTLLLFLAWAVMTLGAFFILEVNLWLPPNTNMVSMARITLGPLGQIVTWACYCLLLFALLSAYAAGGSDLLRQLFSMAGVSMPAWVNTIIFIVVLGAVIFHGVKAVDLTNRGLMTVKLFAYIMVVILVLPHFNLQKLYGGQARLLGSAILVVITSFGYATIIPPLRNYFHSDLNKLRIAITCGSLISLVCYVLWDLTVQGNIAAQGKNGLIAISESGRAVSDLTTQLSHRVNSVWVHEMTHLFTSVCLTTSFLGVGLSLADFVRDGFSIKANLSGKWRVMCITLVPPGLIVIFDPGLFITALRYAGIFCVTLLVLLPVLMVWSGRYHKKIAKGYRVMGGKFFVIAEFIIACALLIYGLISF